MFITIYVIKYCYVDVCYIIVIITDRLVNAQNSISLHNGTLQQVSANGLVNAD